MPTLRLSASPASSRDGVMQVLIMQDAAPRAQVEIRTAADAVKAFDDYAASITTPAYVSGSLARGHRAPPGFRKLKLGKSVNL